MNDETAALALARWARRNHFHIMFEVRRIREDDVLFLLMRKGRVAAERPTPVVR
jgi:hypothetical protein